MQYTEEEAYSKWCPMAIVGSTLGRPGINRIFVPAEKSEDGKAHIRVPDGCQCIASACAVWLPMSKTKEHNLGSCGLARKGGQTK